MKEGAIVTVMQNKLPIGIEDFADIRKLGFYYVDKTKLIRELLNNWAKVNLFTRPRRFGKTLNMSMLKYFFEIGQDPSLFDGLAIAEELTLCKTYMGKFPVIFISLKGISGDNFKIAQSMMAAEVRREAQRFQHLLESSRLTEYDKKLYIQLLNIEELKTPLSDTVLMNSLLNLSILLRKHYGQKVILLLDEYDVPLNQAFENHYYDQMVALMRNFLGQALKTNDSLYFAVLTGCLRVSKESIFTGLNNFKVLSITDVQYDEYFGFTDREVNQLLRCYNREDRFSITKEWYDGYHFGNADVYCPWDVICYCDALRAKWDAKPAPYWINTSSNNIVKRFIQKAGKQTQREIEHLIAGETIQKRIRQELTYHEIDQTIDNLWSVLFTTGYLTQKGKPDGNQYQLAIPNLEIHEIFVNQIREWFQEIVLQDSARLDAFCNAFKKGDAEAIEEQFNAYLMRTISIRDTSIRKNKKENFYHGILLGLLSHDPTWIPSSNAESGEGYSDILIEMEEAQKGIIIEIKYAENDSLDDSCIRAMKQIEEKRYAEKFQMDGIKTIFAYGIACFKKHCKVVFEEKRL